MPSISSTGWAACFRTASGKVWIPRIATAVVYRARTVAATPRDPAQVAWAGVPPRMRVRLASKERLLDESVRAGREGEAGERGDGEPDRGARVPPDADAVGGTYATGGPEAVVQEGEVSEVDRVREDAEPLEESIREQRSGLQGSRRMPRITRAHRSRPAPGAGARVTSSAGGAQLQAQKGGQGRKNAKEDEVAAAALEPAASRQPVP